jgi:hypothetical protein
MDIHDIKPPGGDDPYVAPEDQAVNGKRDGRFSEATSKLESSDLSGPTPSNLDVVAKLQKTELDDPAKLDSSVRASVSELIDAHQGVTGSLSDVQKQSLVEFLSADPVMRRQVETYLRKAAV